MNGLHAQPTNRVFTDVASYQSSRSGAPVILRSLWSCLSPLTRVGLTLTALGVVADFVHHVFAPAVHVGHFLPVEVVGHVLTLAGMFFALAGVVNAARQARRRAREKGGSDAARRSAAATG